MDRSTRDLMAEVAEQLDIQVIFVQDGDEHCAANGRDQYINRSVCYGRAVEIGMYDDKEIELISFFHEVGHIIDPIDWSKVEGATKWHQEASAWRLAFRLMANYEVDLTDKTRLWAMEQLNSYICFEDREKKNRQKCPYRQPPYCTHCGGHEHLCHF